MITGGYIGDVSFGVLAVRFTPSSVPEPDTLLLLLLGLTILAAIRSREVRP